MSKGRLEAFSDGVLAIIITIMVLELKVPPGHDPDFSALRALLPVFLSYVISFVYIGIYWNNHHHLFQAARHVRGSTLWANLHLLFWLSLVPFVTHWMGDTNFASLPTAAYGVVLLLAGFAYYLLARNLVGLHGKESALAKALGEDFKGQISMGLYALAIPLAFLHAWIAFGIYALVALIWFIPDRRIERELHSDEASN